MDPATPPRRSRRKIIVLSLLALVPVADRRARCAVRLSGGTDELAQRRLVIDREPAGGHAPSLQARVLVMSGRTGGWKGVFAVH